MMRFSVVVIILAMFVISCDNDTKKATDNENTDEATDTEVTDETTDEAIDEVTDTEVEDKADDEVDDADSDELQQLQTGGIVVYDNSQTANPVTVLGQGGFFGYSVFELNETHWAVSAIHESIPPYDFEKATGVLYVIPQVDNFSSLESLDLNSTSVKRITHPEEKYNAGFGFTTAGPCDINNDGSLDLVVSSHLANYGDLYAAGEVIAFYGGEQFGQWGKTNSSISRVSDGLIQKADAMSQSLVCGDIDGDGFDDVLAGGQNAGPELAAGGSAGMVVFFKGSAEGLSENETWTLVPEVEEKAQYFGSSMILQDVNGDEIDDLIVSGWGLKDTKESDKTGGVYIYHGGTDWSKGPSLKAFGTRNSNFGTVIKLVKVGDQTLLGVIASDEGKNGTIYFFDPATMTEKFTVIVPTTLDMGDTGGFSSFDIVKNGTKNMLVAGGKYFKDGGRILCADVTIDGAQELEECSWQPETTSGGFGFSVDVIDSVDATGNSHLIIGMPEYIHEF